MTTSRRPHRALLVLTAAPADDANGNDPWSVFTAEGWTVDITRIEDGSPEPQIAGAPVRASRLGQVGTPGQPGLDGADHDSADYDIVCFVDGSTTTWISPRSADVSRLMSRISENGEVIAAVRPAAFSCLKESSLRHHR